MPEPEIRASLEDPQVPISSARIIDFLGVGGISAAGVNVTTETALGVPSIWAAVNFISGTMASLPLHTYRKEKSGPKKINNKVSKLLHHNVNAEMSSFAWRKQMFERVLTTGRSYTLIMRGELEPIMYLWPLETSKVTVKRNSVGERTYKVGDGPDAKTYPASDIIDISFMLKDDGIGHYSPILTNKDVIGLGIAATNYGSRFFQNGGVPPFVMTGNFQSGPALNRAAADLEESVKKAAKESRLALALPLNHDIKAIGVDPDKAQLVELKKSLVEEYARIYSLPPIFLQDLSHGTFSNTEQQDLHFVKHTITQWAEQVEAELNLKLFGWDKNDRYAEFNLDGLLRGDYKTRMEGNAQGIQNALLTPNEGRGRENLPPLDGGDELQIQGATVPLSSERLVNAPATTGESNNEA